MRLKIQNQQILALPSVIDDIFENRSGKLRDHAIETLTNYIIENIPMFSEYPMKAIEEIAGRLDQRVFAYKD